MAVIFHTRTPVRLLNKLRWGVGLNISSWKVDPAGDFRLEQMGVVGRLRPRILHEHSLTFGFQPVPYDAVPDVLSWTSMHSRMVELGLHFGYQLFERVEVTSGWTEDDHVDPR
jgi:hypothetical protein